MKKSTGLILLFVLVSLASMVSTKLNAQAPVVNAGGILNAASYAVNGMPNAGIPQGSVMVIFGNNLGPTTYTQVNSFPAPTTGGLAGTVVRVTVNNTTVTCIMLYTTKTQVAAVLPSSTPIGTGTLTVVYNGVASAPTAITVVRSSFGIFAVNQAGSGPAVVQNYISDSNQPVNSLTTAAHPGQVEILWGTGIGPVSGDEAASALPGNMPNTSLHVFVGGQEATVTYRGRSGCCVGIDQVAFTVPAGVSGCYVPVWVQVDNVVSNFTSISVNATGNNCGDAGGYSESDWNTARNNGGLRISSLAVQRFFLRTIGVPISILGSRYDSVDAVYGRVPLETLLKTQGAPPIGSCVVNPIPGITLPPNTPLNAGTVSINGPVGNRTLAVQNVGSRYLFFSPGLTPAPAGYITDGTLVTAGTYNFTATGGSEVGAHNASINHSASFVWTQFETIGTNLPRSQGLVVNWTGGSPGGIVVVGGQSQSAPGIGAQFACYADAAAGSFTVPAAILSALPVSTFLSGIAQGSLFVLHTKFGDRLNIPGIDVGNINAFDGYNVGPIAFQ